MISIIYTDLIYFCKETLKKAGLDNESVEAATKGLCETSLRGVDSHGIRLSPHYVESAKNGRKSPKLK
jgi:LDH2 family malate/lactate/ureidoglycolate dehydrogenase